MALHSLKHSKMAYQEVISGLEDAYVNTIQMITLFIEQAIRENKFQVTIDIDNFHAHLRQDSIQNHHDVDGELVNEAVQDIHKILNFYGYDIKENHRSNERQILIVFNACL